MRHESFVPTQSETEGLISRAYGGLVPLVRDIRKLGQALDHLKVGAVGPIRSLTRQRRLFEPFPRAQNVFEAQDQENGDPGKDQQLDQRGVHSYLVWAFGWHRPIRVLM